MASFAQKEGRESPEESFECSHLLSGDRDLYQMVYVCETCYAGTNQCCCVGCASTCHAGHDVNMVGYAPCYCDCGASGCVHSSSARSTVRKGEAARASSTTGPTSAGPEWPLFQSHTFSHTGFVAPAKRESLELVQRSKETFWLALDSAPRCALEELALAVLYAHGGKVAAMGGAAVAGVEWWVQVKDPTSHQGGIDVHYDKDEALAEKYGVGVFPTVSTVTYLTGQAGVGLASQPTCVLDTKWGDEVGEPIEDMFVSFPRTGKHIAFRGNLLHGAPRLPPIDTAAGATEGKESKTATEEGEAEEGHRISFLVNVWTSASGRPEGCVPLSDSIATPLAQASEWTRSALTLEIEEDEVATGRNLEVLQVEHEDESKGEGVDVIKVVLDKGEEEGEKKSPSGVEWTSVLLPFVSRDAAWGVGEDEQELLLMCSVPTAGVTGLEGPDGATNLHIRAEATEDSEPVMCLFYPGELSDEDEDEDEDEEEIWSEDSKDAECGRSAGDDDSI